MELNNLILMEVEKETGFYKRDIASFSINKNHIKKFYYDGDKIQAYFEPEEDVEEWQYTALFDVFPLEDFTSKNFLIEEIEDEFNPRWKVSFDYPSSNQELNDRIYELFYLIEDSLEKSFELSNLNKEEYI